MSASDHRFEALKGLKNVFVDDNFRLSAMFPDQWDPSKEDWHWFVNHMYHLDVMVTFASTLSLDAAMRDKPIINVAYGAQFTKDGVDVTDTMYRMHHYQNLLKSGGVNIVKKDEELIAGIKSVLSDPTRGHEGRARLRDWYCAKSDGHAAERIARCLFEAVGRKE